ncbi:MAG: pseudouridine synthase, RluA family [uncultured bacterium]|nr:MAG: pseudouridine synthase, RluA family [uncultured bacterium]
MPILNIAGYQFVPLNNLDDLKTQLVALCKAHALLGTILLSPEGININLAGEVTDVELFLSAMKAIKFFSEMRFHQTYSTMIPFQSLKIKIKKEIITFHQPKANPLNAGRASSISPEELKKWLDEKRDITLLDTRNDYEFRFGTFIGAINLHLHNFSELAEAVTTINPHKPVVMFCTGGIRCEKAALYMLHNGFDQVYQLDGGILGYFAKVGGAHYQGECFVFDERIALDPQLKDTDTIQCLACHGPVNLEDQHSHAYVRGVSCPSCQAISS